MISKIKDKLVIEHWAGKKTIVDWKLTPFLEIAAKEIEKRDYYFKQNCIILPGDLALYEAEEPPHLEIHVHRDYCPNFHAPDKTNISLERKIPIPQVRFQKSLLSQEILEQLPASLENSDEVFTEGDIEHNPYSLGSQLRRSFLGAEGIRFESSRGEVNFNMHNSLTSRELYIYSYKDFKLSRDFTRQLAKDIGLEIKSLPVDREYEPIVLLGNYEHAVPMMNWLFDYFERSIGRR